MRIDFSILKQIDKELGPMQVGAVIHEAHQGNISLRFGYWQQIDLSLLNSLLPHYMEAHEHLVDEDDDCGSLWNYTIKKAHIKI